MLRRRQVSSILAILLGVAVLVVHFAGAANPSTRDYGPVRQKSRTIPRDQQPRDPRRQRVIVPSQPEPCPNLPPFESQMWDAAVKTLSHSRFQIRAKNYEASTLPKDTILRSSSGLLDTGGCWAEFWLSDGSLVVVPPVTGLSVSDAQDRLRERDLKAADDVMEVENPMTPGWTFDQDPKKDTEVQRGTAVKLFVSTGLPVPPVTGSSLDDAKKRLSDFSPVTDDLESVRPRGEVISQEPEAGARRAAGTRVLLTISDGSLVVVPEVISETPKMAGSILAAADLDVGIIEGRGSDGIWLWLSSQFPNGVQTTVSGQYPTPGAVAKRRSVVTLQVAKTGLSWIWPVGGGGALVLVSLLFWRAFKPKPRDAGHDGTSAAPVVRVKANVETATAESRIEGALPQGPAIRIRAHIEPGTSAIDTNEEIS